MNRLIFALEKMIELVEEVGKETQRFCEHCNDSHELGHESCKDCWAKRLGDKADVLLRDQRDREKGE